MMDRHRDEFAQPRHASSPGLLLRQGAGCAQAVGGAAAPPWRANLRSPMPGRGRRPGSDSQRRSAPDQRRRARLSPSLHPRAGATSSKGSGKDPGGQVHPTPGRRGEVRLAALWWWLRTRCFQGPPAVAPARRPPLLRGSRGPAPPRASRWRQLLDLGLDKGQDAALMSAPVGVGKGVRDVLG